MKLLIYWSVYLILPCIAEEKVNFRSRQVNADNDCKSFTVTFESREKSKNVHLPDTDSCLGFVIDQTKDGKCDRESYPMTCTFYTIDERHKTNQEAMEFYFPVKNKYNDTSRISDKVEKLLISDGQHLKLKNGLSSRGKKRRGKKDDQYEWVAEAAKKILEADTEKACAPSWKGRQTRSIDCDMCWKWFVPHPCNCNCRGWEDMFGLPGMCMSRCSTEYRVDTKYYCWKPCDRDGQLSLPTGCGFTPADRTCVQSSGACLEKIANVVVSFVEIIAFFLTVGTSGAFKTAGKAALKAGSMTLVKSGLTRAVKAAAKEMAKKLGSNKKLMRELKDLRKEKQDELLEGGAELFLVASMQSDPDFGDIALEIADLLDPTGLVGLGRQFVPPEKCDDMVYMKPIPKENPYLPDLDVLHAIDDVTASPVTQPIVIGSVMYAKERKAHYFFNGNQYSRSTKPPKMDGGYPLKVTDHWGVPKSWTDGLDAVTYSDHMQAYYFFRGAYYSKSYKNSLNKMVTGYPLKITDMWGVPKSWTDGIDSMMYADTFRAYYFFKGDQYAKAQQNSLKNLVQGYPKKIAGNWGVPSSWTDGIDAVMYSEYYKAFYFFKGDKYAKATVASWNQLVPGYPVKIKGRWGVPDEWDKSNSYHLSPVSTTANDTESPRALR